MSKSLETLEKGQGKITEATTDELADLTTFFRSYFKTIRQIVTGEGGFSSREAPEFVGRARTLGQFETFFIVRQLLQGIPASNIFDKYLSLTNRISDVVKKAAGHNFDTVIYPLSGTDITTAVSYVGGSINSRLMTFDNKDIYSCLRSHEETEELVKGVLTERLLMGYHSGDTNMRLTGVATEFAMLGIDPDSVRVRRRQTIEVPQTGRVAVTDVDFELPDGTVVHHRNFGGIMLNKGKVMLAGDCLDKEDFKGNFLRETIEEVFKSANNILLLRKAATKYSDTMAIFYPLLPIGTVLVSDLPPRREKAVFDKIRLPEVNLIDCRTKEIRKALKSIDNNATYVNNSLGYISFDYGYLAEFKRGLPGLLIYRIEAASKKTLSVAT